MFFGSTTRQPIAVRRLGQLLKGLPARPQHYTLPRLVALNLADSNLELPMNPSPRNTRRGGFTLIELLVVIAVFAKRLGGPSA